MKGTTKLFVAACLASATILAGCQENQAVAESPVEEAPQSQLQERDKPEDRDVPVAAPGQTAVLDAIEASYSTKEFAAGAVEDVLIQQILQAGAKAPSARNSQPWQFTVITDRDKVSGVVSNAAEGNVVIVVSGLEDAGEGINVDFDCALATENMYLAAQSLGLGAHIYTGPVRQVNEDKEGYGVPDGYEAVAILCIGHVEDAADAVASATAREDLDSMVRYVTE